jgi:hypothetical protein
MRIECQSDGRFDTNVKKATLKKIKGGCGKQISKNVRQCHNVSFDVLGGFLKWFSFEKTKYSSESSIFEIGA